MKKLPYIIECPYCNVKLLITEYNCRIFIHGYYKSNMKQVGQHLKQLTIQSLLKQKKVIGCMGQFRINLDNTIEKTIGL